MCADTLITDEKVKIAAPEEQPLIAALAWRVDFTEDATTNGPDTVVIKKPRNLTAILTPIDMQKAWEERFRVTGHSLIFVWAPPGVNGPFGVERDLDERTLIRAGVRAVRVAWDGARAVICCADDHLRDAIDAVLRFSAVEWETTDIERLLASNWPVIGEDAPLAHSIRRRQLRRQKRVNALTESCVHMKARYLRIYQCLKPLDPTRPEPSQRLYSELVLAARLYDRLEQLDQPIQFMLDHCEIANTRLIEAKIARTERRNALTEHVLGLAIILVLFFLYYPPLPFLTDRALLAPAIEETAEKATGAPEAESSKATAAAEEAARKAASSMGGVDPLTAEKRAAADQKAKFLNNARRHAEKVGAVAPSKAALAGWYAAKHVAAQAAGGKKLAIGPPRSSRPPRL
jgi:hypothetical protein